jgi:hypothetical protein
MHETIEGAVVEALTPFLEEATVKQAAIDLVSSIRHVVINSTDAPVLVKVPRQLHPLLSSAVDQFIVPVAEADIDVIEIVFESHRERFEELSHRWVLAISDKLE